MFKPKLKVYRGIKCKYNAPESFVYNVNNRKSRSLITLLRAGCLPIKVELGRWQNIPGANRSGKIGNGGEVEDDIHFIFSCVTLNNIRFNYAVELQFDFNNTK